MRNTKHLGPFKWKAGQSGNVSGRPKHHLTRSTVKNIIDKYLAFNKSQLEALILEEKITALEHMVASTILFCIKVGDYSRLDGLLSRAVGKVKEDVEEDVDSTKEVSHLSMNDLLTLVKPITPGTTE